MNGACEFGKCEICGKETCLQRTYFSYDIKCECHSPNHFELVRHCKDCIPTEPRETKVIFSTEKLKEHKPLQNIILEDVVKERKRQDTKWGEQNHRMEFWTGILGE